MAQTPVWSQRHAVRVRSRRILGRAQSLSARYALRPRTGCANARADGIVVVGGDAPTPHAANGLRAAARSARLVARSPLPQRARPVGCANRGVSTHERHLGHLQEGINDGAVMGVSRLARFAFGLKLSLILELLERALCPFPSLRGLACVGQPL